MLRFGRALNGQFLSRRSLGVTQQSETKNEAAEELSAEMKQKEAVNEEAHLKAAIPKEQELKRAFFKESDVQQTLKEVAKEESKPEECHLSKRYLKFREKLRSEAPLSCLPKGAPHPAHEKDPLVPWPNNTNPHTGEIGGPAGPEPTRYGDWERKGRVTDF
ncbi:succinate dehydrogenase assembly factor 4, mitochondrial [Drosophila subobscura]|uniref:succinate dehydrogenase assembly factor 4, mitochondrial n=1 Tax=Drosophila subobscura TaxID=7241 RepID=UPI00155A4D9A|nr:succinate dehydrogenase assembly factor 4, mitochondrial [Drosophila subobscura]